MGIAKPIWIQYNTKGAWRIRAKALYGYWAAPECRHVAPGKAFTSADGAPNTTLIVKSGLSVNVDCQQPTSDPIAFSSWHLTSSAFGDFYACGMALIEEAASYLDGPGRQEARRLGRSALLLYSSESMRLTTRLMQAGSWLLLLRAAREGDVCMQRAARDRVKLRLDALSSASAAPEFNNLPADLRDLISRSVRLLERIFVLDRLLFDYQTGISVGNPVRASLERLDAAFARSHARGP